ncbi:MAG TPA: GNAT family N-acetyltransferase [Solirubrobacteraceae bacterium]|nr:GNAT family N-acetyltransferase [Solirubrobacteraceae bacterium]
MPPPPTLDDLVIRRITPADAQGVAEAFARLSAESRSLRFLTQKAELSAEELRYFTEVDGHSHEALCAVDPGSGDGVGIARFVRDPQDPSRAEVAVTVVDAWQRRGLGTLLLARLADRAREEGIERFTALASGENPAVHALLENLGAPVRRVGGGNGAVEYEVQLPAAGIGDQLQAALRAAGRGHLRLPPAVHDALESALPLRLR